MNPIRLASEDGTREVWACANCKTLTGAGQREAAERCCVCGMCGAVKEKASRYHRTCRSCSDADHAQRLDAYRSKMLALPIVDTNGPVYVDDTDAYHHDVDVARDTAFDDGDDPSTLIVHPCTVGKASTVDLAAAVVEGWCDQFDPDYWDGIELSKGVADALAQAQALVEANAPERWTPDRTKRVVLTTTEEDGR